MGIGIGLAMTPATDSIMGSLPREKAGVGSAVNDTTREVGGALGVAILGSLLAASYHSSMDGSAALHALPAPAASVAHDSLGGAVQVAGQLGAAGQSVVADASRAFVNAMGSTVLVAAAVAVVGALVALIWLPSRAAAPAVDQPETDLVLDANLVRVD
jgi:DHA2 family multidrug resistance protein-like MFS transporter